ncbi:MAG TPA: hypothetical protein VKD04_06090 [Burkholderiales bacterium]|nr:hypothetical protein [Burkholderiales bacterium]
MAATVTGLTLPVALKTAPSRIGRQIISGVSRGGDFRQLGIREVARRAGEIEQEFDASGHFIKRDGVTA